MELDYYLFLFFEELEKLMNSKDVENEINKINFQSDEANTDYEIKEYIKNFIIKNEKYIINEIKGKHLVLNNIKLDELSDFNILKIKNIYLKDDITEEIKNKLKRESITFTSPDILIEFTKGNENHMLPLEVKTTKNNSIPGSSVQQIDKSDWVIFIQRKSKRVKIAIGQYIWAINEKIQFPDRSPRPSLSFNTIKKYKEEYVLNKENAIEVISNDETVGTKLKVINDWEQILIDRWLINLEDKNKQKAWFDVILKKFTLELLEKYDRFDEKTKKSYKDNLK